MIKYYRILNVIVISEYTLKLILIVYTEMHNDV